MQKYLKPAIFIVAAITIWIGPENILFNSSFKEEKLHIGITIIALMIILITKLSPGAPNKQQPKQISKYKQLLLLRKQLKFQLHLLKQSIPFDIKKTSMQLAIADTDSGYEMLMQEYGTIKVKDMPFEIYWHYNDHSIICVISSRLFPGGKAQHNQHLFAEINKTLKIASAHLLIPINKIMSESTDKCLDAFNYTLTEFKQEKQSIPIKIILTKCDQVAGFVPYFEHYDSNKKQQEWLIKFKTTSAFSHEFDKHIKQINENLITRMHVESQLYRRILIKDFPIQLEKLKFKIIASIEQMICNKQWNLNSLALTSATQDGSYTDLISQNIGMQNQAKDLMLTKQRYFCENLFDIKQVRTEPISTILQDTWFQTIVISLLLVFAISLKQLWWLSKLNDITSYELAAIKPKLAIEKHADIWQKWQLANALDKWIQDNPIPRYFKAEAWSINLTKIDKDLFKVVSNEKCDSLVCLQEKWQPFTSPQQLDNRLAWVKSHKNILAFKITKNDDRLAKAKTINLYLKSNFPESNLEQINWLKQLLKLVPPIVSLQDDISTKQLQANQNRIIQMIQILKSLKQGAKAFTAMKNMVLYNTIIPSELSEIEAKIFQKLRLKVISHINKVWQATVLTQYENISNKFPLNQNSKKDLELKSLNKLFSMQSFFNEYYLQPAKKLDIKSKELSGLFAAKNFLVSGNRFDLKFSIMAKNGIMSDISIAQLNIASNVTNLAKNSTQMYHWPIKSLDDTISIWLQNKAGKMSMSSRHGAWGLFRLIASAGQINPGSQIANIEFPIGEQKIALSIYFNKPWANLEFKLPTQII